MSDEFEIPAPVYRVPRARGGLDGGTSRMLMIAAGLGAALLLVLGLSLVGGRHHGAVPLIEADSAPVRIKPDNPGGLAVPGQDDEVMSSAAGADTGKLAPAAEAPALQALRAQERSEAAHAAAATAAALAPAAKPPHPTDAPAAAPAIVASIPAPASAVTEHKAAVAATHPAAAGSAAASAAVVSASVAHATEVQLGALTSEAAAHQEWSRLSHKAPDLLAARQPAISQLDHNGHTLWRLRTGGFADVAEATVFCQRARAKGLPCSIAAF